MNVQNTELAAVQTAVAEFDRVAAGIAALKDQYGGVVYDVTTTQGMKDAKAARSAIREPRYEVERIRKEAKAPILALGKKLDSEAKRITEELLAIENPVDEQIKRREAEVEAEKEARIQAELKRVSDLQERVAELRGCPILTPTSGSALIAGHIGDLEAIAVDDSFQEFRDQAEAAKGAGLTRLRELHAAAVVHEAEQARIQAEREELARLRAEQAKREAEERARIAEEERIARETREAEEAKQREALRREREEQERAAAAERERLAEENRRLQAEREAQEAASRQERERIVAEEKAARERLEAEQRQLAQERAEIERREREAREANERRIAAEQAEAARQQREAREAAERKEREAAENRAREERRQKALENPPPAMDIVKTVAEGYGVDIDVALDWITTLDFSDIPQEEAA